LRVSLGHWYAKQAQRAFSKQEFTQGIALTQQSLYFDPSKAAVQRDFGLAQLEYAQALANKVTTDEKETESLATTVANSLSQAVTAARNATELEPADSQHWLALAKIYEQFPADTPEAQEWAIRAYTKAIERDPTNPKLRIALAQTLSNQNQDKAALTILQQTLELDPLSTPTYYQAAQILLKQGDSQTASQLLEHILTTLTPSSEDQQTILNLLKDASPLSRE